MSIKLAILKSGETVISDAKELVQFGKSFPSKVNIIEYNDTDNSMFRNADDKWINNYVTTLKENRIPVSVRRSRGKDIDAACGQLANKY